MVHVSPGILSERGWDVTAHMHLEYSDGTDGVELSRIRYGVHVCINKVTLEGVIPSHK